MEETRGAFSLISRRFSRLILVGFFLAGSLLAQRPVFAQTATLYFSSIASGKSVGSTFAVNVYAASPEASAAAFSGLISYPASQLEITSLSKDGSVITFWVQEPTFSNSAGTVSFEGVTPNPGFVGSAGKLLTLNFRVKAGGSSQLVFLSGSVLANDGYGTNILSGMGTAPFTFGGASETPPVSPASPPAAPSSPSTPVVPASAGPVVTSITHPDQTAWYSNNDPVFAWDLPEAATGVSVLLNQKPTSDPGWLSDGLLTSKDYTNLADGEWYFHVKTKTAAGWSPITHYHFAIDTVSPLPFTFDFAPGSNDTQAQPHLLFQAEDALSGMGYYLVRVNGVEVENIHAEDLPEGQEYILEPLGVGQNVITIVAVDKAGNSISAEKTFNTTEVFVASAQPLENWRVAAGRALETSKTVIALTAIGLILLIILLAAFALANFILRSVGTWTAEYWRSHRNGTTVMRRNLMAVRKSLLQDIMRLETRRGRSRLNPDQERVLQETIESIYALEQKVSKEIKQL
jgi:hypothetical protein